MLSSIYPTLTECRLGSRQCLELEVGAEYTPLPYSCGGQSEEAEGT